MKRLMPGLCAGLWVAPYAGAWIETAASWI